MSARLPRGTRPLAAATALATTLSALACAAGDRGAARAEGASATAQPSLVVSPWRPHERPVADLGTGVVGVRERGGAVPRVDTLRFRARPADDAPEVGMLLVRTDTASAEGAWHHAVAAADSLAPNLVEYDYEIAGVPVDGAAADGAWVRGLLGTTRSGAWRTGWARVAPDRVELVWWTDRLRDRALFALDTAHVAFADAPDGRAVPAPPGEYAIHPDSAPPEGAWRGPWLRVRVVWPTDECLPDDSLPRQERRAWVRALDARGRPLVWYHSRGC